MDDNIKNEMSNAAVWDAINDLQSRLQCPTWLENTHVKSTYRCMDANLLRKIEILRNELNVLQDRIQARG